MAQSLSSLQKSEILKLIILIFHVKKLNNYVKSQVEARVTIQKIKSLGVLQTETCH
jgi:hypothetical protein